MFRPVFAASILALGSSWLTAGADETAAPVAPAVPSAADYGDQANWLCRPGRQDACSASQDATIVAVNGKLRRETFHPAKNPPIDCFYVYPTVSNEPGGNSDLTITVAEKLVVNAQFARFAAKCRLFAPMYRQVTLTALRAMIVGKPIPVDRDLGYHDVLAAWNYYLAHDNHGRGVVLVGHSQGSGVLTRLIKEEIDGKSIQDKMVSAILMGTSLPVPKGADVGGAFKHVPVCHSNRQLGCVIAFADFRANAPPPADSRFGKAPEGMQAVCANPAALGGGSGVLDAYLSAGRISTGSDLPREPFDWTQPPQPIETSFVKVPGLLSAECVANEHGSYLAVTLHPTPGGARTNEISGDVVVNGQVLKDWGLHLIDANLTMGNLVAIVGDESRAYLAKPKK
ncbi:MAG TPA: DUF3089 domain-containing protein [Steroidobacteraceae bacterium]|jgi:hypothetical protein|nr:DUF3089 domain-containing protein [Steroidobacteraceae bacterium]